MKKVKIKRAAAVSLILLIIASVYFCWGNNSITVSNYTLSPENLPEGFDGFRIVQISDLHNKDFGGRLVEKITALDPAIIVITGDIVDSYNTDIAVAAEFAKAACEIAPVYYITGNHEQRIEEYENLKAQMEGFGVNILDGKTVTLSENGDEISITGIDDLTFFGSSVMNEHLIAFKEELSALAAEKSEKTSILLSHRPELFKIYAGFGFDAVFSGHAHGGQIRLPFIGGVFSPGQGFFPEYTEGIHVSGKTNMIVSRGLGNSLFPLRVFNRPEIVVCEFEVNNEQ